MTAARASGLDVPPIAAESVAVLDVGASGVRLAVARHRHGERPEILEEASRAVLLGRDTFATGRLGAATIDATIRALDGFRRIMDGYAVSRVRAVATSAVREAANADTFLDRVRVRTGLSVEVIDGSEESRLMYLAVRDGLNGHPSFLADCALLVEVGGGGTDVTRLANGQPVQSGLYPIGAVRLRQRVASWHGAHAQRVHLLRAQVATLVGEITREIPLADVAHVIALGSDMRFVAGRLAADQDASARQFSRDAFLEFCASIEPLEEDVLAARFRISPVDAETLVPALITYRAIVGASAATTIVVPDVSLRAGLLADLVGRDTAGSHDFSAQVLASATTLGRRYQFDERHGLFVARLATSLFDQLQHEHGLVARDRLLLEVAALLHDVGLFVSLRAHHKHTLYVLQTSEIFGLSTDDMHLVANVARYHRRGLPQKSHEEFMRHSRDDRVRINKLSAILRVANALDAEHCQKVSAARIEEDDGTWVIEIDGSGDLTMERLAAAYRADLLGDVFGKRVIVRGAGVGA